MSFKKWKIEYNNKVVTRPVKKFVDFLFLPFHGFLAYMFATAFYAFFMFDLFPERFGEVSTNSPAIEAVIAYPIFIWLPALVMALKMVKIIVADVKSIFFDK